jgi:drug/metabolite transporter (DMT)-like permease
MTMKKTTGAVCLVAAATLWGISQVVSKSVLREMPPMTFTLVRFAVAALVLAMAFGAKRNRTPIRPADWVRIALLGLIGYTLSIGSQMLGVRWSSAHMASILTATPPAFMLLFAPFMLREKVTLRKIVSLALSSAGVLLLMNADHGGEAGKRGDALLLVAAVSWALYSIWGIEIFAKYSAMRVTFWALCFGALFSLPLSVWEIAAEGVRFPRDEAVWLGILYVGAMATALGFYLWNKGMELFPSGMAGLFLFIQPFVGVALAWAALGEQIPPMFFTGGLFVLGGIFFATARIGMSVRRRHP